MQWQIKPIIFLALIANLAMEMDAPAGFWVAVAVVVAPLLWWWNDCWYALSLRLRRSAVKLPPGYMGLPFLGEMPAFLWYFKFLRRPDEFIDAKCRKYGDGIGLYRTYLFGSPTVIACTPSANKFILQSESSFGAGWKNPELVGASSLVSVAGAAHTRVRGLVIRAVNQPDALRKITLMVQPRVVASLKSWSKRGRITVFKEAKKVTLASIGKYFANIEEENVLDSLDHFVKGIVNGLKTFSINFPGTTLHYGLQCRRKAKAIFKEELERRKECEDSVPKNDLMEALMQTKDEEGNRLSEDEVLDNIVTLIIIAGYASTSIVMMFALYYLAKSPDILQKLKDEHMLIGKKQGDFVTYDELTSCKYTSKVVEEVIRMANVTTFVARTAKKDVEYNGHTIPKGWRVICWLRYMHTNPKYYEDPMFFNPDRWNEAPKPGSYLVFGGGARACAGNMYARLLVSILLHHLVLGYRWKLINPEAEMIYLPHPSTADEVEIDINQI